MEESALKVSYERRETQEEHLIVQLPVQLRCLHFYTVKEVSSSCDQKLESSANCAKANINKFCVPSFRREQMVNQLSSLLRDV